MASHKERFADKMEFPPETPQPNIYPLSWNSKTRKLQEVWEAALRENWDPEKLPWDTLDVDSYSWEERESIAYWWSLLSVFDASAPPVFAEALIKTYEVHEEDPVRKCFFSVTRDEQNHEIMCGLAITRMLGHPDPLTYDAEDRARQAPAEERAVAVFQRRPLLDRLQAGRAQVRPGRAVQFLPDGRDRRRYHLQADVRQLPRSGLQGRLQEHRP
ncbi:hypothetical protein [Zoogloea sp.]|uniref:hypothetical protein n=1 Tax=Zoogloea sp. TaxID=49181 RepID=UPI0025D93A12|nr:hypothetical protein [Zoogloea sp.]